MYARSALALVALAFVGCSTEPQAVSPEHGLPLGAQALEDASHPTGSTSIAGSSQSSAVYNVNPDAGTISRLDPATGSHTEVDVGVEPSRVATAGDSVYVTLRGDRSVVRLDATDLGRGVTEQVVVGAEPVGIVAREDGKRVYVALSQENRIVELDGETLAPRRSFDIPGEPRYLALHPSGGSLFVGSGRGVAQLTRIDLVDNSTHAIAVPETIRFGVEGVIELVPRITGDLWVTPDGTRLLVPVLYSDTTTPISDVAIEPGQEIPPVEPGVEGYGGDGGGIDKFTPAVVEVGIDETGEPSVESRALFVSTSVFTPNGMMMTVGSYISSVSASPDSERYLVTMEASRAAVLIDPDSVVFGMPIDVATDGVPFPGDETFAPFTMPEEAGFVPPALATLVTGEGSNGAVWLGNRAFVRNAFEDSVGELDVQLGGEILQMHADSMANFGEFVPEGAKWVVSDSPLGAQIKNGRSLFFSATERAMGVGGISCSTCHFEGRNDGITWTFESGVRQTPSLAGRVSETAPVTWTSDVASVADEADLTTRGRMGGEGLNENQLAAIAAYVDWTRLPDTPDQGLDTAAVERGRSIFMRNDVGCAACHSGERFTDNAGHMIRGVANLNTPGLQGVAATAPYLHDGSMATLRDVLEWARSGQMGNTSSLSDAEMDDLEAFLRSL
ncbi:MAG: c-type cytochrome [Alphaproteobacteria bacterium]|nr:c-type cytochrome [Alphaproteobacteria bacterium]